MDTRAQDERHLGDLVHDAHIDGSAPLPDLTADLARIGEWTRDRDRPPVVVLWLHGPVPIRRSWPGPADHQEVSRWERALRGLERSDAVCVAVASGPCCGPALDLLLVADYRIATRDAQLVLPVNDGHMWPGMAVHRLVQQVGIARARQLVLWGHELSAPDALAMGLVDELSDDVDIATRAAALLLGRIAGPELAVRRQLLAEAAASAHEDALGAHLAACDRELRRLAATGQDAASGTEHGDRSS